MLVISGPKIYTEQGVLKQIALTIHENKIHAMEPAHSVSMKDCLTFPETYHLLPGFIDVHIHGANGSDVMDGDIAALAAISQAVASQGTTLFLATTMTASIDKIESVLCNIRHFMQHPAKGAKIFGAHLEGPFLSPKKVGAQREDKIALPNFEYIKQWQKASDQVIRLVTIAPELAGSIAFIRELAKNKIIASIGHTDATYTETVDAIAAGCSHVTHLFNAMRGMQQREPGVVGAALMSEQVSAELIVDGVHVHPAMVKLALKAKGKEKLMLVTDAMRAACMPDGEYELGEQVVSVKDRIARLTDGTLAGSTLTMAAAVKNMLQFTDCDLLDVIKFSAENPAKLLNIFHQKGSIALNKDADLVVLDEQQNVVLTIVEGKVVYCAPRYKDDKGSNLDN